jgi:hypothetical protein
MIKLELETAEAAALMQLLLKEQENYSFEFAPARIEVIRGVINKLDDSYTDTLLADKEDVLVPVGEITQP